MNEIKMIIGICGGSGSGKTSLVKKLAESLDPNDVSILSMDDYYKEYDKQKLDENGIVNFDLPGAIEHERIIHDISKLKMGETIQIQEYTFNNPKMEPKLKTLTPSKILIVEGIFLLFFQDLLEQLDFSVYIDVDPHIQLSRRMKRDLKMRGYSEDQIRYQWENHVIPCFEEYIEPFIKNADIVIDNNEKDEFNVQPIIDKIHLVTA